ncbi:DUF6668 family protein [Streptomyces pseudovenezuelae]|uniref:DUF6668 family protein n=1 Tax=Streptomyces pseudovenezuelae TaxID=67350 RepID=UPI0036E1E019
MDVTRDAPTNNWLTQGRSSTQDTRHAQEVAPANLPAQVLRPQPHSVPAPAGGLGFAHPQYTVPGVLTWVGCHGGAGVTTLEHALPGGRDGSRMWPGAVPGPTVPVLLVCRSHVPGLMAAQTAVRQWASGSVPGVDLLGLVVVADAPGSMPRPIKDLATLVRGGVSRSWFVPWVEPWRFGENPAAHLPRPLARLRSELAHHFTSTGSSHV